MGEITFYAKKLHNELKKKGINSFIEFSDGHKSVDIYIPEANLIIEVDGRHHTKAKQALTDLKRAAYSLDSGAVTYHLPNTVVYKYTSECADQIKLMVGKRIKQKKELEQSLGKIDKEKSQLEIELSKEKDDKIKEKLKLEIKDKIKNYKITSEKLKKLNEVKNNIKNYYGRFKILLDNSAKGLKYISWASLMLSLISWLFSLGGDFAMFFLKLFAVLVVLRIVIFVTARSLHFKINEKWVHLNKFQRILDYFAGAFVVLAFATWIFNFNKQVPLFLAKLLVSVIALRIIISLDKRIS